MGRLALALALLVLLLAPFTARAIDLTTDMGGFSGGQITGLRDTFVDQTTAETVGSSRLPNGASAWNTRWAGCCEMRSGAKGDDPGKTRPMIGRVIEQELKISVSNAMRPTATRS